MFPIIKTFNLIQGEEFQEQGTGKIGLKCSTNEGYTVVVLGIPNINFIKSNGFPIEIICAKCYKTNGDWEIPEDSALYSDLEAWQP